MANGAIVGRTREGSPNSFLATEQTYGDFELELRVDDALNSGVQIRSGTKQRSTGEGADDRAGRVFGPQVEIETSPGLAGYLYGEATGRGWLTPEARRVPHAHFRNGQWNRYRIVAEGPHIRTWVNGEPTDDLTDEDIYRTHPEGFHRLASARQRAGQGSLRGGVAPSAPAGTPGMIHARPQLPRSWAKRPARRSPSGEEGLDDQGEDAGDHDTVHPLEQIDLGLDDRELLVEPGEVVFDLWYFGGMLLDPLEPAWPITRLSAAARAFSSEAPASFSASYSSTSIVLICDLRIDMMNIELASIKQSARAELRYAGPCARCPGVAASGAAPQTANAIRM